MRKKNKILTYHDRIKMETMLNYGCSKAEVSRYLNVTRAAITYEYKKGIYMHTNTDLTETEAYSAEIAQRKTDWNVTSRGKTLKIGYDYKLVECLEHLIVELGLSPEAALAYIKKKNMEFDTAISVRTLYRYIDNGLFEHITNDNLPVKCCRKKKKGKVIRIQKRSSAGESIENRPSHIDTRQEVGHWEMDTVKGKKGKTKGCLLVLSERKTRNEIVLKMKDQTASSVVCALNALENSLGNDFTKIFKSITVDNGVEFAFCDAMEQSNLANKEKKTKVYYCHAYSSWERGTNENINKMVRRRVPKGSDIDIYSREYVLEVQRWINAYPRRIFGFKSAEEYYKEECLKADIDEKVIDKVLNWSWTN